MSLGDLRWLLAFALLLTGWLLTRWVAGARLRFSAALPMDLLLPVTIFLLVLVLSARPLLAGIVALAVGAGWARADRDKRRVLAEPIVFTDVLQAFDIFRHPQLALPFPHKGRVLLVAVATLTFFAGVIMMEPPAWSGRPWLPLLFVLAASISVALGRSLLPRGYLNFRQQLSADPLLDTARHGSLATVLLYGLFARHERARRRASLGPAGVANSDAFHGGPVLLVQNESFFDARRLHPAIPKDLLPQFDRGCRDSLSWGRLAVPSWGANTVRTEFAVLSGLTQQALGFDRFNPYYRFADAPLATLAHRFRAAGYRTICLHPFDCSFYRRDQVMPNLGFDELLGEERFAGAARVNGYVSDIEVARVATEIIREQGPKVFLFIITIENHGPWFGAPDQQIGDLTSLPLDAGERLGLNHYLSSLVHADTMFGLLRAELAAHTVPATLGFYGDHLPSFPSVFSKLGWRDAHSDYLIWHSRAGSGQQQDLAAEDLAAAFFEACCVSH